VQLWICLLTIAEKILATKSGKTSVSPGEIVEAFPDLMDSPS
jgi:hypothetical protein